ncbi:MAG: leucine-rich repeat protein, partial [Eubacterium sp.]|nr:leucine-rich repeat protein [Eubacterium sp.]
MEQTKTTGQRLSSVSKKAISLLLSLIMLFSITAGIDFSAFAAGGSSDLIYGSTTTRAQWLHNLVITFDMYVDKNEYPDNYFSDLSETHMFYDDIITAVNFGVVDIEAGEELRPDAAATREFAAHTLNFCLGFQLDEAAGYTFSDSASCEYPDDNQIAVNRAWVKLSSGKFNPSVNLTLAEAKAMLTDAKSVLEDSVIDENYDSAWNVSNGIIEVPEYADVAVDGNKVTIVNSPVTIKTGNKFVVYSGGIGLPFTAKSVSISGNTTTITTTDLDPDQAFDAVDAEGVIDSDEIIFSPADDSVSLEVEETYGNAASAYSSRKTQKQQNAILDTEIDFGNGAKAKIKGKFSNIKVTYRIFDGSGEASANVEGDLDVTCTASISGSVIGKGNAQLLNCTIPGIGGLTITFDVTAAGTASCHSKSHVSFGIACSMKNGFRILKSFQEKSSRLNAEAETNMGLQLKFGVTQMPALSAYVYADTGLNAKASVSTFNDGKTPKKCTTFMAYLYARYGAHASSRFVKKAYNKTETVYDKNNSPVRVYHHYEDNKEVSKCTRGNAGFKYYTKYNSRYASSGWYGGMGTYGLDDTGIQIPIWEYTLNDEQEATITKYNGNAGSVYIPETLDGYTVVALGDGLFRNKTNMYAVEIPNTVTKIGSYVFDNTGLTSLVLPSKLTYMGGC